MDIAAVEFVGSSLTRISKQRTPLAEKNARLERVIQNRWGAPIPTD